LLTLRGAECLQTADVVLYDYLANPALLRHARSDARLICAGKHGRDRIITQDEINRLLIQFSREGQTVVRLKGGDPAIFARVSEEAAALSAAGIRYEIVPGITAALAAGSYAGIPLTERSIASAVAFITGHEQDDKHIPPLDFDALARFPGTLVFYMGVTTALEWTNALIAAGKPAKTPAAIVRRCTWPDQRIILCTLGDVASRIAADQLRPPIITIVGDVVSHAEVRNWFTARPLFGQRVLVTRPRHQAADLVAPLEQLGAQCYVQPAIEIRPPTDWADVDRAIAGLPDFDWLVFSSSNGVEYFLDRLFNQGYGTRSLTHVRIAAIGAATAEALSRYHLRADLIPDEFRAESLAETLVTAAREQKKARFLLIRASRGREVLAESLAAAGFTVHQVVAYHSVDVEAADPDIAALLSAGKFDWVTVTSSAIARSLAKLFGNDLRRAKLASISPVTSATLRELGFEPAVEGKEFTMLGVVAAIAAATGRTTTAAL
jgi:uroporphyrinogen III methyltransferase/synthase